MHEIAIQESALRSAGDGLERAKAVSAILDQGLSVRIDFAAVEIMTPSFANAFVMTLLERYPIERLRSGCEFLNRSEVVIESMNRAVTRYQNGIRLSSQLASA